MFNGKRFSIIGFNKNNKDPSKYYHCPIHQSTRLVPLANEEGMYQCPECGMPFNPSEVLSDTKITSRFSTTQGDRQIVSLTKKEKVFYDKQGNKLPQNDPDILRDVASGHTIVSYHTTEDLETDKPFRFTKKR